VGPPSVVRARPPGRRTPLAVALATAVLIPAALAAAPPAPAAAQTPAEVGVALARLEGGVATTALEERLAALLAAADPDVLPGGLADLDPARVAASVEAWAVVAPEWRTVGRELAERVAACRDGDPAGDPAADCGDPLRAQLWLRHAEELRLTLEGRFGAAAELATEERARLEAELLRARDRAVERLRLLEDCDAEQLRLLERSCDQLRDRIAELERLGRAGMGVRP